EQKKRTNHLLQNRTILFALDISCILPLTYALFMLISKLKIFEKQIMLFFFKLNWISKGVIIQASNLK
ncbi:MAG: hypothetical protein COX51_06395, partial [Syntrophobacteraceae bacterium CG23_combo_of_CG06-09_8_20_14_all_50_8]